MRRSLVGLLLVVASLAQAAPTFKRLPVDPNGRLTTETVNRLDVLDVAPDKGFAALKVIHEPLDAMGEGLPNCKYPGMGEFPTSGVRLALWDLEAQRVVEEWVVYAAATRPEECSATPTNEANLAAAKARFLTAGLDIAKKPAPVAPKGGSYDLVIAGNATRVTVAVTASSDEAAGVTTHTQTLAVGGVAFFERTWTNDHGIMWMKHFAFGNAYVMGTKVVFVEDDYTTSMRSNDHRLGLSPMFDLGS